MTRINNNNQNLNSMFSNSSEVGSVSEEPSFRLDSLGYQMRDYHQPLLQQHSRAGTMSSYTSTHVGTQSFKTCFTKYEMYQDGFSDTLKSIGLDNEDYGKRLTRFRRNRSQSVSPVVARIHSNSLYPSTRPRASSMDDCFDIWNITSGIHQNYEQKLISTLIVKDSEFMTGIRNLSECESYRKENLGAINVKESVSNILWVGNIDSATSVEELTQVFSGYGPIESIKLLLGKECGFINFYCQEDAIQAKEDISKRLGGRIGPYVLRIGYGRADHLTNEISEFIQPTRALWLGNLPPNLADIALQKIFSPFGVIESIRILSQKHCGFINYGTAESASAARDSILGNEIQELIGVRVGFAKVPTTTENILENHEKIDTYIELMIILKQFGTDENTYNMVESLQGISYIESIPLVPEYGSNRILDAQRLKDIRKRLDKIGKGHTEADELAFECLNEITMICSDYIGNTVIQRLFEKCSEDMKTKMLQIIVPHLASISVHKNGTWVAQKIIELASTKYQMKLICQHLQPFIPSLLLDPFGNYVVQGCLRLNWDTQFIIYAVVTKLPLIAQGRFGARAIRGILESEFTSPSQQILIAAALIQNAVPLSTHSNGVLALSCLIDSPLIENKRHLISSRLVPHITELATSKFGSHILLKLTYHYENEAQKYILEVLEDEKIMSSILSEHSHGLPFVLKVISSQQIPEENRIRLQNIAHPLLTQIQGTRYKKVFLEFVNVGVF